MNERNQSGNAGGSAGLPNARSYHYRFGVDGGKNPNLPNEADRARVGGVLEVAGPGGAQPANQALPHGWGGVPAAGYLGRRSRIAFRVWWARERIAHSVDASAEKAQREIKAMAESARRSLAQILRSDRAGAVITARLYEFHKKGGDGNEEVQRQGRRRQKEVLNAKVIHLCGTTPVTGLFRK